MDEVKLLESLSSIFGNPEGSENAVNELKVKKQERELLAKSEILSKIKDSSEEFITDSCLT